jgi:glycosyltransferase involved in cell wall biosynthesis
MPKDTPVTSVVIATYEMSGMGRRYLQDALQSIHAQEQIEVEVVVVDDSRDNAIQEECHEWKSQLALKYLRNTEPRISASAKFNRAINASSGSIIKVLCQDDVLMGRDSLRRTVDALSAGAVWAVSAYAHIDEFGQVIGSHVPQLHRHIERVNTIGSHSGLAFLRVKEIERFDESLFWRMDCELYRRLYERFGPPKILLDKTVGVRQWRGQSTNSIIKRSRRVREWCHVAKKYPRGLHLPNE